MNEPGGYFRLTVAMQRTMRRTSTFLGFAALLWTTLSASSASAQEATAFLQSQHTAAERLLKQRQSARRDQQLDQMLQGLLDVDRLAQDAMRDHWHRLSDAEKQQFTDLLRQLIQSNYQERLQSTANFEVAYEREVPADGGVTVETLVRDRRNRRRPPVALHYTLRRVGAAWKIVDITTDGVSMVVNYRRQFNRIIRRNDFAHLITTMQEQLGDGASGAAAAP